MGLFAGKESQIRLVRLLEFQHTRTKRAGGERLVSADSMLVAVLIWRDLWMWRRYFAILCSAKGTDQGSPSDAYGHRKSSRTARYLRIFWAPKQNSAQSMLRLLQISRQLTCLLWSPRNCKEHSHGGVSLALKSLKLPQPEKFDFLIDLELSSMLLCIWEWRWCFSQGLMAPAEAKAGVRKGKSGRAGKAKGEGKKGGTKDGTCCMHCWKSISAYLEHVLDIFESSKYDPESRKSAPLVVRRRWWSWLWAASAEERALRCF